MIVIKVIFIVILALYTFTKICDSALKKAGVEDRIVTLIEIIAGILLMFIVYKL